MSDSNRPLSIEELQLLSELAGQKYQKEMRRIVSLPERRERYDAIAWEVARIEATVFLGSDPLHVSDPAWIEKIEESAKEMMRTRPLFHAAVEAHTHLIEAMVDAALSREAPEGAVRDDRTFEAGDVVSLSHPQDYQESLAAHFRVTGVDEAGHLTIEKVED